MLNDTRDTTSSYPTVTIEHFWGCELSKDKPSIKWPIMDEDGDQDFLQHILFLKHAVLGEAAENGQRNIVQISTKDYEGNTIEQPLFSLTLGSNDMVNLDHSFVDSIEVKLTLVSGNGPVCISAQQCVEVPCDFSDDDDDDIDYTATEDEELTEEESDKITSKKRKAATAWDKKNKSKGKKMKEESKEEKGEDDDDEEDISMEDSEESEEKSATEEETEESDEEEEEESPVKEKKKSKSSKKAKVEALLKKGTTPSQKTKVKTPISDRKMSRSSKKSTKNRK